MLRITLPRTCRVIKTKARSNPADIVEELSHLWSSLYYLDFCVQKRAPVKKITIAILLFSPLALAAGNTNPTGYTVNVHVSSSSMDPHGVQLLDVVIDGKKYELKSELPIGRLLALGDFKAKLVTNRKTAYESFQVYEFLFPDKTRQYDVVGQTE
jgi:hypothetical protein